MRCLIALAVCALLGATAARSEILYARPDEAPADAAYRWGADVVPGAIPLTEAINTARATNGSRPLEIRLLHRADARETLYSVDLRTIRSALRWQGSEINKLVIRGQIDRSGALPRALTTIIGGPLGAIVCKPEDVDLCTAPAPDRANGVRQDLLDYLAGELDRLDPAVTEGSTPPNVRFRLNCFVIWRSAFVEMTELGLRDCWLAAVATYASSHIAVRDSVIDGSTYAFAAIGRKGDPESAHTFEITGNIWRQSPSAYRTAIGPCDIHNDWTCPVSVWSDIPWAVVHHHFWSPLNGALFTAKDILGNVRIANNYVGDAYNGVRARLSALCLADANCREKANAGFEIVGNTFEKIRDNPIEPEGHAAFWVIKHNTFVNVYAAISTDSVSGHDFLVFGNIFALDEAPGAACRDDGWTGSRQFRLTLGGGGQWSNEGAQGDDARCSTHVLGTVIKLGTDDNNPRAPLLQRILFFNNSLRTRNPLFRGSPAPPITSYNNAVQFIGCGRRGPAFCRQEPEPDPSCSDIWTTDGEAVYAACFPVHDGDGRPIPHLMRFNAFNRPLGPEFDWIEKDRVPAAVAFAGPVASATSAPDGIARMFAIDPASPMATGGCALRYAGGDLSCPGTPGPVGAMLPDGQRFDLDLPFRFPFIDVIRRLNDHTSAPK
jgi:hypothetical protein